MRRHSHRLRSASRHPTLLRRIASAAFLVIGAGLLVGLCLLTPIGRFLLACTAVVPVLYALVRISYVAGRGAASLHNSIALQSARTGLEKTFRGQLARPR